MTLSPVAAPVERTAGSLALDGAIERFRLEPRCRVCRNDRLRRKVNGLLAVGSSYAMIVRALEGDNATIDPRVRVMIDSVRNHHCTRHFPVQNVAQATYREILERRAEQNGLDFVDGVATALSAMAFFETVMVKPYGSLVGPDTTVDMGTGMIAAGRLQAFLDARTGQHDVSRAERTSHPDRGGSEVVRATSDVGRHSRKAGSARTAGPPKTDESEDVAEAFEPDDCDNFDGDY